ncbi:MAG: HAD-IC family P-type ATPase, partial [Acholeplasmatales bacterium]|nr:HAD-IC family P-type ATPase [Acholeplasmatales bacterium]
MENFLGLTTLEVNKRIKDGKYNKEIKNQSRTIGQIILTNVVTFFNFVFIVLAALLIIVKAYKSLTFLPLIFINTLIGIIQEIKSKIAIDKLRLLNTQTAEVYRDNSVVKINVNQIVLDDIIKFNAGDQICCDAVVLDGEANLNEALLSGESDEIKKTVNSTLLSGSFVVSGSVIARVVAVGKDSYINKLALEAKKVNDHETSEIIQSLNKILKFIGILIIPLAVALFCEQYFIASLPIDKAITQMVGSVLMMIPEGLFLLASVSLAISAYRLAKKNVLLHNMKSIEALARVNVLCIDKTGTITSSNLTVNDFIPLDKSSKEELFNKISMFVSAQNNDNATMISLKNFFKEINSDYINISSFSSKYKYSAVNYKDITYVLGAPDLLLKNDLDKYNNYILKYSKEGYRVLLFGTSDKSLNGEEINLKINPIGLIIMSNEIRDNAVQTFSYFKSQNVDIKVISGDAALTVSNVAKRAGISDADNFIDCSNISDEDIKEAALKYNVFGRVDPETKRKIIIALKENGNKVAMTGDGVNDVLALKEADCSIALASGSDAAIASSQVVLLDNDFSKLPQIVFEGRRVVNNLERSGALFLSKNVFAFVFAIICIISLSSFPILPNQASLINMFTIGAPAFLLSQVPNKNRIKGNFITTILKIAIPAGFTDAVMVGTMVIIGNSIDLSLEEISTCSTMIMAIIGILVVINVSRPYTKYKAIVSITCLGGLVANTILATSPPKHVILTMALY